MRRILVGAVAMLAMAGAGTAMAAGRSEVVVESGRIRGAIEDGVVSWKGIPFAAPPVGPLRWRAPQPAPKWSGIRDATRYGHDCMQLPFPSDAAPLGTEPAEDCLVLNVWAPERAAPKAKLPVIVWIYGGGFVNGGSSPPTYSGANLARKGVVFVSFNYRVGRFGTFLHPELVRENGERELVGNYGFMDQLAALQWVQRNIAKFGGDPGNVTLIGESAGGMSVNVMVTSPMARGLVHRAVVMSGGNGQTGGDAGRMEAERASLAFAAAKGIAADDPQAIAKLRALPARDVVDGLNLTSISAPSGPRTFAGPYADGKLAVDPASAYASGQFAHAPVMIGATSNDIGGPTGYMVAGARTLAGTIAGHGVPTYHYRFSYVAESLGKSGADHASDIPFFFDTQKVKYGDAATARDLAMGQAISDYLVNFAKTGDPNGAGLPHWPLYDRTTDQLMDFAAHGKPVAGKDPLGAMIDGAAAR